VGCFMPPPAMFPILCPHGPPGSGKSTLQEQIESVVDPRTDDAPAGVPSGVEALMLVAERAWLLRFNNVSSLTDDQSNLLCTLVEGTTLPKRTAYTDKDLTVLRARRPAILNGISIVPDRTDLLDRCLPIGLLRPRPPKGRQRAAGAAASETGSEAAAEGVVHRKKAELKAALE